MGADYDRRCAALKASRQRARGSPPVPVKGRPSMTGERGFAGDWVLDVANAIAEVADIEDVCSRTGVSWEALRVPPERVANAVVVSMLDHAAARVADPLLGLHLAERLRPRGALTYFAATQATLRDALAQVSRFQHLLCAGRSVVLAERGATHALIVFASHPSMESRHLTELFAASAVLEVGSWIESDGVVDAVRFRHAAAGAPTEYERVLGCPVYFDGGEDAVVLPSPALELPLAGANAGVAGALRPLLRSLVETGAALPFRERVGLVIRSALLSGDQPAAAVVAERLAVRAAALRQGLRAEATSYDELVESVQRALAPTLLGLGTLLPDEVAARCGFASAADFAAAFERWTGRSPFARRSCS